MAEIITYFESNPYNGTDRENFIERLKEILAGRVLEAYLFGSVARNEADGRSDIDLILVVETDSPFLKRENEFSDLRDFNASISPLIYTPAEFRELSRNPSNGFWQQVTEEMIRII